jgi:hypothetical protein
MRLLQKSKNKVTDEYDSNSMLKVETTSFGKRYNDYDAATIKINEEIFLSSR